MIIGAGGKGSQGRGNEGGLLASCARATRGLQKALVGRAQWEAKQAALLGKEKEARTYEMKEEGLLQ